MASPSCTQTTKLVELIRSGAIGEVRMIKSSFGFAMPSFMPGHRLCANDPAGCITSSTDAWKARLEARQTGGPGGPFCDERWEVAMSNAA